MSTDGVPERKLFVNSNATRADGHGGTKIEGMNDGERLKELLERNGKQPRDLQRAMGISRQMIHRYLSMPKIRSSTKEKIIAALDDMKIDPSELTESPDTIMDPDEVRALLAHIPHEALRDLKRMLQSDKATRVALLALITDRIERKR